MHDQLRGIIDDLLVEQGMHVPTQCNHSASKPQLFVRFLRREAVPFQLRFELGIKSGCCWRARRESCGGAAVLVVLGDWFDPVTCLAFRPKALFQRRER